jgi:hypothetical protein
MTWVQSLEPKTNKNKTNEKAAALGGTRRTWVPHSSLYNASDEEASNACLEAGAVSRKMPPTGECMESTGTKLVS